MRPNEHCLELSREILEVTMEIIGPDSTAAKVLQAADEYEGPTRFWLDQEADVVILERMPEEDGDDQVRCV